MRRVSLFDTVMTVIDVAEYVLHADFITLPGHMLEGCEAMENLSLVPF